MRRRTLHLMLLALLAAGCQRAAPPPPTPSPAPPASPTPPPTATIARGPQPSATPPPFTLETPVVVVEPSAAAATPSPPPLPGRPPGEVVFIQRPAAGLQVVSPFRIVGRAGPTWNGQLRLLLIGEDGRTISTTTTILLANPGNAGLFSTTMEFSIPGLAEAARLEVLNFSRLDGEMDHLGSVHLTLLSEGYGVTYLTVRGPEQLAILNPDPWDSVQGGIARVEGIGWTKGPGPLVVEVQTRQGEVLGRAETHVQSAGPGQMGPFQAAVPYSVAAKTRGRIVIYEMDTTIPGYLHYSSLPVTLEP